MGRHREPDTWLRRRLHDRKCSSYLILRRQLARQSRYEVHRISGKTRAHDFGHLVAAARARAEHDEGGSRLDQVSGLAVRVAPLDYVRAPPQPKSRPVDDRQRERPVAGDRVRARLADSEQLRNVANVDQLRENAVPTRTVHESGTLSELIRTVPVVGAITRRTHPVRVSLAIRSTVAGNSEPPGRANIRTALGDHLKPERQPPWH